MTTGIPTRAGTRTRPTLPGPRSGDRYRYPGPGGRSVRLSPPTQWVHRRMCYAHDRATPSNGMVSAIMMHSGASADAPEWHQQLRCVPRMQQWPTPRAAPKRSQRRRLNWVTVGSRRSRPAVLQRRTARSDVGVCRDGVDQQHLQRRAARVDAGGG